MLLEQWALRHGVSAQAMQELRQSVLGQRVERASSVRESMSESSVSQRTELAFGEIGGTFWRNNVGVLKDERGIPVRYGLANTSKKVNISTKSGDLIGCLPVVIRPDHVGRTFGLFVSAETKKAAWQWKGDAHELAQANWAQIITALGGVGFFVNDPIQIEALRNI